MFIEVAYAVANRYFIKNGNNRIIITKNHMYMNMLMDDLDPRIDQKNKMDISLTNAHYEQRDYENEAITMLTENKQVRHIYRDATNSVENILVSDFLASRLTVAKDVKVQVVFNPAKVQAYRLIGYEKQLTHREVSDKEPKNTGDIGVGHSVTALYEIIPAGIESSFIPTFNSLNQNMQPVKDTKYRGSGLFALKVRYKSIKKDRNKVTRIRVKDQHKALKNTSDNFRFSAAVAEMGLLFNRSAYIPTASYSAAIELAEGAYGEDKEGTRHKFVELMKKLSWVYFEKQTQVEDIK